MKLYKKLGIYKNSSGTLTYNPLTKESRSYSWYALSLKIGPYLVVNNYSYSKTTSRHRRKIVNHINSTLSKIDFFIEAPNGLSDLDSAERLYKGRIQKLQDLIATKGTHKKKNQHRMREINLWQERLNVVYLLQEVKYREQFDIKFTEDLDKMLTYA